MPDTRDTLVINKRGATMGVMRRSAVATAGLVTSVATAVVVATIDALTGFNLFTFSIWLVLPAGAIVCGGLAASGYFFAAKHFHERPTPLLLVQMLVIAAATQLLIYWLEYEAATVDGTRIAGLVSFADYMRVNLTTAHVLIGRISADTGEVGSFGYLLALLDFAGFVAGGVFVYYQLRQQPTCTPCNQYLRTRFTKKDKFGDYTDYTDYADRLYDDPVDSPAFAERVRTENREGAGVGTLCMTTKVLECPGCQQQWIGETVDRVTGRGTRRIDELTRMTIMPTGINVLPAFDGSSRSSAAIITPADA